jgi:formylglycine-generating enzyme required for sulfatase activity
MENADARVEQLFGQALDLPREQRAAFLDETCADRPDLRQQVQQLLDENDRLTGFLHSSPWMENTGGSGSPNSAQPLGPGTRLGRYSLTELLGAGGMGVVYRARDEKLERTVAIKILASGFLTDAAMRSHFRREALALARLNHPNIAALYDVGEQDGIDYLVMECVQGQSLRAHLQAGPLPAAEATRIAVEIAGALEEAHARGVIHRDLKPANVMLSPRGHAKVLDFGVAKLLAAPDATQSHHHTSALVGTPLYMSPEQALGKPVDARADLWSLGALYFETLTGRPPFQGDSVLAVLQAITQERLTPLRQIRPDAPEQADRIVQRALQKDPANRYATAADMARDASALLATMSAGVPLTSQPFTRFLRTIAAALALIVVAGATTGWWLYRRMAEHRWAREDAVPQIESLLEGRRPLAAFALLRRAENDLPGDAHLRQIANAGTQLVSITSEPSGAQVSIQDYLALHGPALPLGVTPLQIRIPKGHFRWTVAKAGIGTMLVAPATAQSMDFPLAPAQKAPPGMVYAAGGSWGDYNAFIGWMGPYRFPPYDIDRYEVTNRQYQTFLDDGGYQKPQYWPAVFQRDGQTLPWSQAISLFRDTTDRPGPSTWAGGHYPQGHADFPVAGVSWFEASAYAAWAGKTLPVLGQWYQAADFEDAGSTVQLANLTTGHPAPAGAYQDLGADGTYDLAGNAREWIANPVDGDVRFILGGSWKSPNYLYTSPEALSPFDRSDTNGFRCVRNLGAIPAAAASPIHRITRDFAKYTPVSDAVFRAYSLLYAYPKTPLNAQSEGVVKETEDWREEKVTFDTAYNSERMSAYLFLPKRVKPPYQTILFFPSARVLFLPPDSSELGDVNFFDYIIQSGRAVMYPVYEDTYERRHAHLLPAQPDSVNEPVDWYKDAARAIDYLDTRSDIDKEKRAYLGVSMGAADGVIFATMLQDRLRTAIFLDGGYFLVKPSPGFDQADFAPRMKKPVLMVNGRYDFTFPVETSQDPLFRMFGTPAADKRHVLLETPHDVTEDRPALVREVLAWLDRYLGRVASSSP